MTCIRLLTFSLTCVFAISGLAQSFVWELPPDNYADIQCVGKRLYKINHKDRPTTVISISADGETVSKISCDEITRFYMNWALLIKYEREKRQVVGCISLDGTCNLFKEMFYTLANQEFYSEGFLTVENSNGEKVYIDHVGHEMIGTGRNYSRIKPFSEGYAVIFVDDNKRSEYINKDGKSQQIRSSLLNNVELFQVTNFYHGKALMMGRNKEFFICDINGNGEKLSRKPKSLENYVDYLYRFVSHGEDVMKVPPSDSDYKGEENSFVIPIVEGKGKNARYGYSMTKDNKTILPCQFAFAEPFHDGFAIVKTAEGKRGILRYLSDATIEFNVAPVQPTIFFDEPHEAVTCQFTVSPTQWHGHQIRAEIEDSKSKSVKSEGDGRFSFSYVPVGQNTKVNFNINLFSDDILLAVRAITIEFYKKEPPKCKTCGIEIRKCADRGKHVTCKKCKRIIDHNGILKDRCPVNGNHKITEGICPEPDCHKPISECPYKGDHRIH